MNERAASRPGVRKAESSSISTTLLERVRVHDPDAWRRLVRLYGPLVFRWCRLSQVQPSDAADVVQEVFRSVVASLPAFRRDRPGDSFRGWLWTITRNKIRDQKRRRASSPRAAGGSDAHDQIEQVAELPSDPDADADENSLVHRALELIRPEFEDRTWQAFWRSAVEEHPTAAIAEDLAMSKGAVRQAKCRVLGRLRRELEGLA